MGADADACRAVIVKRIQEELIPLRELQGRVRTGSRRAGPAGGASAHLDPRGRAARRLAHCLAEVRMTYHRAWRDLVKDLETGDQEEKPGPILMMRRMVTIRIRIKIKIKIRMGRRERRLKCPRRLSFTRSRGTLPRERTRYPRRLVAKRMNFYHSNPRKLLTGRRNLVKPSWFPSSIRPLGLRAQKAICLGARGVQTGSKTVDPDRAPTPQRPQDKWARPAPGAGRAGARAKTGGAPALTRPRPTSPGGEVRRSAPEQGHDGGDHGCAGVDAIGAPAPRMRRPEPARFLRSALGFITLPTPEPSFSRSQGAV